jgi:hypothetical protein
MRSNALRKCAHLRERLSLLACGLVIFCSIRLEICNKLAFWVPGNVVATLQGPLEQPTGVSEQIL